MSVNDCTNDNHALPSMNTQPASLAHTNNKASLTPTDDDAQEPADFMPQSLAITMTCNQMEHG